MIPTGEDHRIRSALKYMEPMKVLQWAQATICPSINHRDIGRIARDMAKPRRIGTSKDTAAAPYNSQPLVDDGTLGRKIEAYMARVANDNGYEVSDLKRRCYGWA